MKTKFKDAEIGLSPDKPKSKNQRYKTTKKGLSYSGNYVSTQVR
jgi:hypothetical protein